LKFGPLRGLFLRACVIGWGNSLVGTIPKSGILVKRKMIGGKRFLKD
jgi:hypothetical protein